MNETVTIEGEIVETNVPMLSDAMAGTLARAEIDMQVATARQYPRSIKRAMDNILTLATLDEQTALESIYALKRGGKPIRGPSIRLAEIIVTQWGNNRSGAQVVSIDRLNKLINAEGFFHDLETNSATKATVQRRISDSKGRLFNDDMIAITGNAACSIAKRNAILAGVPKGIWRKAVEAAEQIIRGDAKTLIERREAAIKAFAHFNLAPEQVFQIMAVAGADDIDIDDLVTLRAIYTSLKNGEQTVEELLRGKTQASDHQKVENPLSDEPASQGATADTGKEETAETTNATGEPASTQPEDNSQSSDTPPDDHGSDGPPSPDQTVAADSSATSEVQNPDEAASEAGDVETQEEPDVSSASDLVTRNLMVECLEKFVALATDETVPEATKRRHNVEFAKNAWKEALPQRLDFVKTCFETADKIVKGELGAEAAKRYLEGLV